MALPCTSAMASGDGLVTNLLGSVDCNVQALSAAGYHGLAQAGSPVAVALTGLLTLYIAFIGFRMMIGRAPLSVGETTVSMLKIGAVLVLATSWPAYQTLVFNVLFLGPSELGRAVLDATGAAGAAAPGDPFVGLQHAFDEMLVSAAFFARLSLPTVSPLLGGVPFSAVSLNAAAYLMIFSTLGVLLAAKIVLGLLLALGPLFACCLLFDASRGLFEGWLRAALAFALAPLVAELALVVQLVMVEPQLARLSQMRASGEVDQAAATAVLLLTLVTAAVSLAGLVGVGIVTTGLRFPWSPATRRAAAARGETVVQPGAAASVAIDTRGVPVRAIEPRAAAVAAAASAMERRESRVSVLERAPERQAGPAASRRDGNFEAPRDERIGQSYRRAAQPRRAASNLRRDR